MSYQLINFTGGNGILSIHSTDPLIDTLSVPPENHVFHHKKEKKTTTTTIKKEKKPLPRPEDKQ